MAGDTVMMLPEAPEPPKKEILYYQLDDQVSQAKKLCKADSLVQVRKQLNLPEPFVFLIKKSDINTTAEVDFTLEEILEQMAGGTFLFRLKSIKAQVPVVTRFAPHPSARFNSDRNGLKIFQYPHIRIRPDPKYPGSEIVSEKEMLSAKVIIFMGPIGTGKSTTINAMVNFLQGVRPDDDFRYELIIEETRRDQSKSQTTEPKIYCVRSNIGYPTVVIIDTPGYGDTGGLERDQKIDEMVKDLFKVQVELVHLVCFVAKASMNRIGALENYVYGKVLNLFGKDIGENFQFLITFADGGKSEAEVSLKAADSNVAPIIQNLEENKKEWKSSFNNSAVFKPMDPVKDPISVHFWGLYSNSMKSFFQKLMTTEAKSLMMTRDVIKERGQLEALLANLNSQFSQQIIKSDSLQNLLENFKANLSALNYNKDYTQEVIVPSVIKQDIKDGSFTTLCIPCNRTCHPRCIYGTNASKENCAAMKNGKCTVCPNKCHHTDHMNVDFIIVVTEKTTIQTIEEMKSRYLEADAGLTDGENMILGVLRQQDLLHVECLEIQEQMRITIERLSKIALRANCYDTTSQFIEMMIVNEESNPKVNLAKVKLLKEALKKNQYADKMMKDDPSLKDRPKNQVLEDMVSKGVFRKTAEDVKKLLSK